MTQLFEYVMLNVRLLTLNVCVVIASAVFFIMLAMTARHRLERRSQGVPESSAVAEYLWLVTPWVIIVMGALPAVRSIWVRL